MARKAKRDLTMEEQLSRGPIDLPFLMLVLLLVGIGIVMVFSASFASAYYYKPDPYFYFKRQLIYAFLGVAVMYGVSRVNYQYLRALSFPMLLGSIVLLALVLSPLGVSINKATRWLKMFLIFGPTYQPSEIAKIAVILFFSAKLSKRGSRKKKKFTNRTFWGRFRNMLERIGFLELLPYGLWLGVVLLLIVKEPHMSGTILTMIGAASVLFASGVSLWWFAAGGTLAATALGLIIAATDYMTTRIEIWHNPWLDPLGKGFQPSQALIAIGSGGLLGKGLGQSIQKYLFLPEPENDYVFAIIVEELGFIGAALILFLFALLVLRGYWLAIHARDRFGMLTTIGITTLLAFQVLFNIAVVTNTIPSTGISLPFFSFGGTALVMQLAEMGIILSISRQIPAPKKD